MIYVVDLVVCLNHNMTEEIENAIK